MHLHEKNADRKRIMTPVWFDYDGTHVRFNTARGRVKDRNLCAAIRRWRSR